MKNLVAKVALISLVGVVGASAEGSFIGLNSGYNFSSKLKADGGFNLKDKNSNFGFKAGYNYDTHRVYGEFIHTTKAKDKDIVGEFGSGELSWKSNAFVIGADLTPQIAGGLKGLLGGYAGVARYEFNYKINSIIGSFSEKDKETAGILGARLGAIYDFDGHSDVELGVKAQRAFFKDGSITDYGAFFGYNYKF